MLDPNAKPLDLCKWFVPHLARAMSLSEVDEIDETYECGPFTISFKGRNDDAGGDPTLPRKVRRAADKVQDVYRAISAIWNTAGRAPGPVMPKAIISWLRAEYERAEPDRAKRKDAPRSSVHHALTDLQALGFVYQHADGGWVMGTRPVLKQGPLFDEEGVPNANGTHSPLEQTPTVADASPAGGDSGPPAEPGARDMAGKHIWVPGEKDEFGSGGLVVTDTGGTSHLVEGKQERVRFVSGSGRPAAPLAVCCELVSVEDRGRYQAATVRIKTPEGRKLVTVRVLGDWQLAGRTSDRELTTSA